jgi:uncharacterized protein YqgV (UPF0045/DUF77 family)
MNIWPRKEQPRDLDERLPPDWLTRAEDSLARGEGVAYSYAPMRTAQIIASELDHLREELKNARELVEKGEAKELELVAERDRKIDEEKAAHEAECAAKLAELEKLRAGAAGEQP